MASVTRSIKLSGDLVEASTILAERRGHTSWSGYIKALIRQDGAAELSGKAHKSLRNMPLAMQDKCDDLLLRRARKLNA